MLIVEPVDDIRTFAPDVMESCFRNFAGIVICPLLVIVDSVGILVKL